MIEFLLTAIFVGGAPAFIVWLIINLASNQPPTSEEDT